MNLENVRCGCCDLEELECESAAHNTEEVTVETGEDI